MNKYRTLENKKRDNMIGLLVLIFAGILVAIFLNRNAVSRVGKIAEVLNVYKLIFLGIACIGLLIATIKSMKHKLGAMTALMFIAGFVIMLYFTANWCYKLIIDACSPAVEEQLMVSGTAKEEFYGAHPLHVKYTVYGYNLKNHEEETFRIDEEHYEDLREAMDDISNQEIDEKTEAENIIILVKYLPGTKTLMELSRME